VTRRHLLAALLGAVQPQAVCWLTLDLLHGTKTVHWRGYSQPVSFGSLLKPFLALAFAATHSAFPRVTCHGARDGCWRVRGHGEQGVVEALAHSCNSYFLRLAGLIDRAALDATCLTYGLALPARTLRPEELIGLGGSWRNSPLAVAQAFARLTDPTILRGMAQCAASGTAKNVDLACYAKTGTAPCSHTPRAAGDGYVAVLYPIGQPRAVLLLQHHGTTGAEACRDVRQRIDWQ
jgi:hypothetical protein